MVRGIDTEKALPKAIAAWLDKQHSENVYEIVLAQGQHRYPHLSTAIKLAKGSTADKIKAANIWLETEQSAAYAAGLRVPEFKAAWGSLHKRDRENPERLSMWSPEFALFFDDFVQPEMRRQKEKHQVHLANEARKRRLAEEEREREYQAREDKSLEAGKALGFILASDERPELPSAATLLIPTESAADGTLAITEADDRVAAVMRAFEEVGADTVCAGKMSEGDMADFLYQLKEKIFPLLQGVGHRAPTPSFPALQCSSSFAADSTSSLSSRSILSTETSGTTHATDSTFTVGTNSTFTVGTDSTFAVDTASVSESDSLPFPHDDGPVIYRSLGARAVAPALAATPNTDDGAKRAKAGNQAPQATVVVGGQPASTLQSPMIFRSMPIDNGSQNGAQATAKAAETATAAATKAATATATATASATEAQRVPSAAAPLAALTAAMRPPRTPLHGNGESPAILDAVHALHLMLKPLALSAPDLQRISTVVCRIARSCASLELSASGREWLGGLPSDAPLTKPERAVPLASAMEAAQMLAHAAEGRAVRRGMRAHACTRGVAAADAAHASQAARAKQHTQCAFYFDYGDKPPGGRQRYVVIQLVFDCSYASYLAEFNRGKNWRENSALWRVESMHVVTTRSSRALWEVAALEMQARGGGGSAVVAPAGAGTSRGDGESDEGESGDAGGVSDDDDVGDDGECGVKGDADASMEPSSEQFCRWSWDYARLEQWRESADSGGGDGHATTITAMPRADVIDTALKALARCADMTPLRHDDVRA